MNTVMGIEAILSAINLGLCLLTTSLLLSRNDPQRIYMPLIVLFAALSVSSISTIFELFPLYPYLQHTSTVFAYVSLLLLFPVLWIYVRNITSQHVIHWQRKDVLHLVPLALGVGVGVFLLTLPENLREQILNEGSGPTTSLLLGAAISLFILMLIWVSQSMAYLFIIVRRLMRHRAQLKQYFSSTDHKELLWIYGVATLLLCALACSVIGMFTHVIDDIAYIIDGIDLLLIFTLAHWGLRQGSPMEAVLKGMNEASPAFSEVENINKVTVKYEKSALTEAHIDRIESHLLNVIEEGKLYLDPNLSLTNLAKAVGEPPNYVSQTLNGRIGETFFDFVNSWRIKESIVKMTRHEMSILEIAYEVGFNSRSSFYKAFKRETGLTPSAYKKQHKK